jgi:hypothetical protein
MSQRESMRDQQALRLSSGTDTGHGETNVNSRTNTAEEELGFQEYLAVSDRDNLSNQSISNVLSWT